MNRHRRTPPAPIQPIRAGIALAAIAATTVSAEGDWMMVMPAGEFRARDGRGPWNAGAERELNAIIERSLAYLGGTEMMVDYDHDQGRAAGWVKQLEARADGIWARVEWTGAARAAIQAGEYRYLSPLLTDKKGRVDLLLNVALVNMPALDLAATAASQTLNPQQQEETAVEFMAQLRAALGLAAEADEATILQAIAANATRLAAQPGDATALTALRAELTATATALAALRRQVAEGEATSLVDGAIAEGRVGVKPLRAHYIARASASADGLTQVRTELAALPVLGGGSVLPQDAATPPAKLTALSAAQAEAARLVGIAPDKVLEIVNQEIGA